MKYLGIDYGTKRVGLAVSDEGGMLAKPLETINTKDALEYIIDFCETKDVGQIIIGKSVNQLGGNNDVQEKVNEFVADITMRLPVPIHFQDEAFSSHVAHGTFGKESLNAKKTKFDTPNNLDARAAAVILQRYLDKNNKNF